MSADIHPLIAAALAAPKTHEVVATYADGAVRITQTRSLASANTHADCVERPRLGRDLIDRATGKTVRIVDVTVRPIAH